MCDARQVDARRPGGCRCSRCRVPRLLHRDDAVELLEVQVLQIAAAPILSRSAAASMPTPTEPGRSTTSRTTEPSPGLSTRQPGCRGAQPSRRGLDQPARRAETPPVDRGQPPRMIQCLRLRHRQQHRRGRSPADPDHPRRRKCSTESSRTKWSHRQQPTKSVAWHRSTKARRSSVGAADDGRCGVPQLRGSRRDARRRPSGALAVARTTHNASTPVRSSSRIRVASQ